MKSVSTWDRVYRASDRNGIFEDEKIYRDHIEKLWESMDDESDYFK